MTNAAPNAGAFEDDALMRRVAARDGAAFKALVEAYAARPHRIAWRMLGDASEAQDVAQEALLRLWNIAPAWQGKGRDGHGGVAAWLTRVATNLCLDRLRRRVRIADEPVPERADAAPLADAVLAAEDERARVKRALEALPERQRAAIVLTYYEEMPNLAAAELLGLNIKAFESLLLRARKALKAMLAGGHEGEGGNDDG